MGPNHNHYVLIMCGGSGPRLWPLSRSGFPKQFLTLFGPRSLFQETVDRFLDFLPATNIFIITQRKYLNEVTRQIKGQLPRRQIILEPAKKNTLMAAAYGTAWLYKKFGPVTVTLAPSDHHLSKLSLFQKQIKLSADLARNSESIITIGITPRFPNPGFGYLLPGPSCPGFYIVNKFIEKPPVSEAKILMGKKALWNSGIYTFTSATLFSEMKLHAPGHLRLINHFLNGTRPAADIYLRVKKISIDKALSEKSSRLLTIPASFTWSDVGEWPSVWDNLPQDQNHHAALSPNTRYLSVNSQNCLVSAPPNKLIGLVGVDHLSVIDTPDALLVGNFQDSYNVRELVAAMVKSKKLKKYFLSKNDR